MLRVLDQQIGRQTRLRQDPLDGARGGAVAELDGGDVDGDDEVVAGGVPAGGLLAGAEQDVLADRGDLPDLLGDRDEVHRRDHASFGVLPPDEGFGADGPAAGNVDQRPVVDDELVAQTRVDRSVPTPARKLQAMRDFVAKDSLLLE